MQARDLFSHLRNNCFDVMPFIPSLWLRRAQYFKLNFQRYTIFAFDMFSTKTHLYLFSPSQMKMK